MGVSERGACSQGDIGRGTYRYQGKSAADEPVVRRLIRELARLRPQFGSPRLTALVPRELGAVNHKRVERIYAQAAGQSHIGRTRLRVDRDSLNRPFMKQAPNCSGSRRPNTRPKVS